jgi:alkanesulfonate monooxygenase SsuD/methylene tetrahydromethanopterin reductase-like flavin-dependent oxidoreductase (luciferase family)
MNAAIPIGVLDLVPVASGSTPGQAVANSIDLARRAEALGYARHWFAEHHLNPGVAGTAPAVMVGLAAAATTSMRIGSGGVQMGHRTPLSVVEEFGLLDAAYPGRLDLGLGRTLGTPRRKPAPSGEAEGAGGAAGGDRTRPPRPPKPPARTVDGVLIPSPPSLGYLRHSPRVPMQRDLLQQPDAYTPDYVEQIGQILALLRGDYLSADGLDAHVHPGEGARVQVWILGSSGGDSAEVAGHNALRFAANYHVSPATVLDAVEGYQEAFRPGGELDLPYICVSADAVVAETEEEARRLTEGYALWVLSIRSGEGARPFPGPEEAAAHQWTEAERALVIDRTETQFVGTPAQVADQLERLATLTAASEVVVTTVTHRHEDRVRSYELLAAEWQARQPKSA